jgi:hypothetical protein
MTLGPILAGALTERFGYYTMCWTLSKLLMPPFLVFSYYSPILIYRRHLHRHGHHGPYFPGFEKYGREGQSSRGQCRIKPILRRGVRQSSKVSNITYISQGI